MKRHRKATYRSGLEDNVHAQLTQLDIDFGYETEKLRYTVPAVERTYTPYFVVTTSSGKKIYIETKGIWDHDDRRKHLLLRQQHPELDIRFVFTRSTSRIRKGSKTTYADICEGRGRAPFKDIKWKYSDKLVPPEWLEE